MKENHPPIFEKKHGITFWCCEDHCKEAVEKSNNEKKKKISKSDQ